MVLNARALTIRLVVVAGVAHTDGERRRKGAIPLSVQAKVKLHFQNLVPILTAELERPAPSRNALYSRRGQRGRDPCWMSSFNLFHIMR